MIGQNVSKNSIIMLRYKTLFGRGEIEFSLGQQGIDKWVDRFDWGYDDHPKLMTANSSNQYNFT